MKTKIIAGVVLTFFIITLLFLQLQKEPKPLTIDSSVASIVPQKSSERVWTKNNLVKNFTSDVSFLNPSRIKVFNNELFVNDIGSMLLYRISLMGDSINTIGNGIGRGPGEVSRLLDFSVNETDVFFLDDREKTISHFQIDGNFLDSFFFKDPTLKIASLDSSVILFNILSENLFKVFSDDGEIKDEFGAFVANQTDSPLSLDGHLVLDQDKNLYFFTTFASYMVSFDRDYVPTMHELIDKVPLQTSKDIKKPSGQVRFFAPNPDLKFSNASFSGDTVSVFMRLDNEETKERWIDQYVSSTGEYIRSIKVPSNLKSAVVHSNVIYAVNDTSLISFKIPIE